MRTNLENTKKEHTKSDVKSDVRQSYVNQNDVKTDQRQNDVNQYKTTFGNNVNLKFEITQIEQTSEDFYSALCNVEGDNYSQKSVSFNEIVLRSLNYLFTQCVDPSTIDSYSHWNLTFAKSILDKNNTFGYVPILDAPSNTYIEVFENEYSKEAFFFIQLAYYLNEIDLTQNQFFKYITYYFETRTKLSDSLYKLDLKHLYKKYNDIDEGNVHVAKNLLKKHFYGCLFIVLNELNLPSNNFKKTDKGGRVYNAMTSSPKELRKYFPFELFEFDIQAAFPHFIDMEIDSNVSKNIYENLAITQNIDREEAKTLFNRKLNSGKYYNREHFYKFFYPIYKEKTNALIDIIKNEKTPFWKLMQSYEKVAIDTFTKINKAYNGTRLHDAIYIIKNNFLDIKELEFCFYSFGEKAISKKDNRLNFQVSKDKPSLSYVSSLPNDLRQLDIHFESDSKKGFKYKGNNFDIYNIPFQYIKASFNISHKGKFVKDEFVLLSEKEFLCRCFNMVSVIRELNPNISYDVFKLLVNSIVNHIYKYGVYSFNKNTLIDLMLNEIENTELQPIVKTKDWYFKGIEDKNNITFYEFNMFLNEVRKEADLFFQCSAILPAIKNSYLNRKKIFIKHSDIGITSKRGNEFLYELINEFNMCNGFGKDVRFAESLQDFLKGVHKLCHNKYNNTLIVTDIVYKSSENALSKEFNIHRQTAKKIKNWFAFTQMRNRIENIYFIIESIANNTNSNYVIEKDKDRRLSIKEVIEEEEKKIRLTPGEAFNYELDLKNSVLNIAEEEARQTNENFFLSWFLFNYKGQYSKVDAIDIRQNKTELYKGNYIPYFLRKLSA